MSKNINFNADENNYGGLIGYLFMSSELQDSLKVIKSMYTDERYEKYLESFKYIPTHKKNIDFLSFEEIVARLNNLTNKEIFGNFDKCSFILQGKFKNKYFRLYDYKSDNCVHIGGDHGLNVKELVDELDVLITNTQPKSFTAKYYYDDTRGKKYSYTNKYENIYYKKHNGVFTKHTDIKITF